MVVCVCDLSFFYNLLTDNKEWCGLFRIENNCLVSHTLNPGPEIVDNIRASCVYLLPGTDNYPPVIWHTHPLISKGYPSAEDLSKVRKHEKIKNSIIFTKWGIWQIIYNGPANEISEKARYYIHGQISYDLYKIRRSNEISNENMGLINNYIDRIYNEFGITLIFDRWQDTFENRLCYIKV